MAVPTRIPCTAVSVPPAPAGITGTGARTPGALGGPVGAAGPGAAAGPVRTAPARNLPPTAGSAPVACAVPAGFIWD
ncbi:hypothetical protein ACPCTO_36100 [Streptomyces olivoreticuli]